MPRQISELSSLKKAELIKIIIELDRDKLALQTENEQYLKQIDEYQDADDEKQAVAMKQDVKIKLERRSRSASTGKDTPAESENLKKLGQKLTNAINLTGSTENAENSVFIINRPSTTTNSTQTSIPTPSEPKKNSKEAELEKLKVTSLVSLKLERVEQEKSDTEQKLVETRRTSAKHLSEKVQLLKEIDDLKEKALRSDDLLRKSKDANAMINEDLAMTKEKQLAVVKNTVQVMLEEYFQLNQHVTEPKYGKPKFDF